MDAGPTCDHAVPKALGLSRDCAIELNDIGMAQRVEDINLRGMDNSYEILLHIRTCITGQIDCSGEQKVSSTQQHK